MAGTMARSSEGMATRCVTPSDTRAATNRRGSVTTSCTDRGTHARDDHKAEPQLRRQLVEVQVSSIAALSLNTGGEPHSRSGCLQLSRSVTDSFHRELCQQLAVDQLC